MKQLVITLFFASVLLSCSKNNFAVKEGVHVNNIAAAEQLLGLEYTPSERDSMQSYLNRNLRGYNERMKYPLGNEIPQALYFDPTPLAFSFEPRGTEKGFTPSKTVTLPDHEDDLAFYSIVELAGLLRTGQMTSVELTRYFLDRIKTYDSQLFSVITLTEERALEMASKADSELAEGNDRGVLHGIPYGVKDLVAVNGYPTTWGAAPYKNQVLPYDGEVIRRLDEAGAVLIAKLSSGALASGDVWFGEKTRNPWNTEQGASGSSAGPGAAVSAGLVPFALGTETWGSIISPSNRCGITGLRPTFGRVSRAGCMTLSWSMDKIGPMCSSSEDAAIVLQAIAGADRDDRSTISYPLNLDVDVSTLKVAYLEDLFKTEYSNRANDSLALEVFKEMGYELVPVSLPDSIPYGSLQTIIRAESGALFDELTRSNQDELMIRQGRFARPTTLRQSHFIPAVEYIMANRHRAVLIEKMHTLFEEFDVILSPTFGGNQSLATNLTGHPVIALPNGLNDGEPGSISIIGRLYEENVILTLGEMFQKATSFEEMHPPSFYRAEN